MTWRRTGPWIVLLALLALNVCVWLWRHDVFTLGFTLRASSADAAAFDQATNGQATADQATTDPSTANAQRIALGVKEPWRWQRQIAPEQVSLMGADELARAQAAATRRLLPCWQLGPLSPAVFKAWEDLMQGQTEPLWDSTLQGAARWVVFMGPYASEAVLERKRKELQALRLAPQDLHHPQWGQGLSLGAFEQQAQALSALAMLGQQGVRTARVLQDPMSDGRIIQAWSDDAAWRAQILMRLAQALSSSRTTSPTSPISPTIWQSCPARKPS